MQLKINNKSKIEIFSSIFQLLKNWGSHINMQYNITGLYIQLMDKSHICLCEINLEKQWFSEYNINQSYSLSVNSQHFATLMTYALKHDVLEIKYNHEEKSGKDNLYINFVGSKDSFDHFFEIPLIDTDDEIMEIPEVEYNVDLSINSKKLGDSLNELMIIGSDLTIICNEELLEMTSNGDNGNLKLKIETEKLHEFSINEGEVINISYSLSHICKMCMSTKLSDNIILGISDEYPMLFKYSLGENSYTKFYIAPKVAND